MIYLDNAATTFPKPESVIRAVTECLSKYCANAGRSSHALAVRTAEEIYKAREAVAEHLSFHLPERVVFVQNATYALNTAIKSLIPKGTHVLISDLEHNSVLRPIESLMRQGEITYSVFSTSGNVKDNIERLIKPETSAIVSTLCSNVTGKEIPIGLLCHVARAHDLIFIADGSQIFGHKRIDLTKNPCDAFCAPAHKGAFGIQGCGIICFAGNTLPTRGLVEGGTGSYSRSPLMPSELPDLIEGGTLPTPSIVALRHGLEYIRNYTPEAADIYLSELRISFLERIASLPKLCVRAHGTSIISFTGNGISADDIIRHLNSCAIAARGGLHCAPLAHKTLGTENGGTVRISLSLFNDTKDADALYRTLKAL